MSCRCAPKNLFEEMVTFVQAAGGRVRWAERAHLMRSPGREGATRGFPLPCLGSAARGGCKMNAGPEGLGRTEKANGEKPRSRLPRGVRPASRSDGPV